MELAVVDWRRCEWNWFCFCKNCNKRRHNNNYLVHFHSQPLCLCSVHALLEIEPSSLIQSDIWRSVYLFVFLFFSASYFSNSEFFHLPQAQTHDMLQTMVSLRSPPVGLQTSTASEIFILRDLAVALSACIYQSLCDSDTFIVKQNVETNGCHSPGMETLARLNASCQSTHLMANAGGSRRRRKYSSDEPIAVSTLPSKWPGVTNLRALLAREKDEDTPRLNVLLCEAFMATFMSLLVYGLSTCDCHILYRLAGQKFTNLSWGNLFGGGVKKLLRKASSRAHATIQEISQTSQDTILENGEATNAESGVWGAVTSITKQRVKLNMKLLGHFGGSQGSPNMKEDKPTYREQFVPPEMSMVSYFMMKPSIRGKKKTVFYFYFDDIFYNLEF